MISSTYMEKFLHKFQHLKIQLEEITSATNNFDDQNNCIGRGGYGKVYKGEVSHSKGRSVVAIKRLDHASRQGTPEFLKEITMLSDYKHENVISLLGFCCEGGEMILVYELASRGSLDRHLKSPLLTWRQRLKICLDAAKGISHLHDPRETHRRLIHCDVKSGNILLDDQWNAKVADLGLSIMGSANEQHSVIVTPAAGTEGYIDPVYWMTHTLTKESDVYSFGVVLFEVLCGTLCCTYSNGCVQQNLVPWWIESYKKKKLYDIIFKNLTIPPMDHSTLEIFSDIAYRCLNESREDRPNMDEVVIALTTALRHQEAFLQQLQLLNIPLVEITSATNHFNDENCIGGGTFGKVYKGEVSHSEGRGIVAIKRLDHASRQGVPEFLKEITMLSDYKHENVISLLGFCCEGGEMILVYELASRGSLDRYLNSPHLTWRQRLKICIDAAKGLRYLHDPRETHQRLIHCDVKSGNILLNDQWNAKVADVGLSIIGSANEQHSLIVTAAAGTVGYIDPVYWMTNTLTKESDVYSFGVVLFEVLCGRLCYTLDNKGHVVKEILTWIKSYEQNMLSDIIFENPNIEPMHQNVLKRFSGIAYQCLKESREDRPEMSEIVTELESALNIHELFQNEEFIGKWNDQLHEYQQMIKTAKPPLNYKSEDELISLMFKGVLLNGGKTWFWLNKKGEHYEMISIGECLVSDVKSNRFSSICNSRFAVGTYEWYIYELNADVRTQFLSPGITYTVNVVFKYDREVERRCEDISLKYRLQEERESSISYLAYEREDGWWACELYQFTTDHRTVDLQILFEGYHDLGFLQVEGIEFQPLENVEHIDENQLISDSDSDANWEEKLPLDYEEIMKWSKNSLQWTTKEEAYSIIRKGFLISDDKTETGIWFSLDKHGKKCHVLSAACMRFYDTYEKMFFSESRFGEAIRFKKKYIFIETKVQSQLVSSETTYACYLVYKLPEDQSGFEAPVKVEDERCDSVDKIWYIYLTSPQTPVIRPKAGENTHNPLNRPKIKGLPQQRNDGWIEVKIWELRAATTINMELTLGLCEKKKFSGLIIEGIEFRPI